MFKAIIAALAAGVVMGGCATIVEGTDQDLTIDTDPKEAVCEARQKGKEVGATSQRNPVLTVGKSRDDLIITCSAAGYEPKTVRIESSASGWGVAGAVTLDFGITDYMTGALNKYPENISVVLIPEGEAPVDEVPPADDESVAAADRSREDSAMKADDSETDEVVSEEGEAPLEDEEMTTLPDSPQAPADTDHDAQPSLGDLADQTDGSELTEDGAPAE